MRYLYERTAFLMDADLRQHWLEALRSKEWAGREIHTQLADGRGNYCALGLLGRIAGQDVDAPNNTPVYDWLEKQGVLVSRVWHVFDAYELTFGQFADWLEAHSEPVQ